MADSNPITKPCTKCKRDLSRDAFSRNKNRDDGLQAWCKSCMKAKKDATRDRILAQAREYYLANRERHNEYSRQYYQIHKDETHQYGKLWRSKNAETLKAKKAAYAKRPDVAAKMVERNRERRKADPERANGYSRKWRKNNPEKRRASSKQNKMRRDQVAGTCTASQWIAKCEYFGWRCYLCRAPLTAKITHMDHRKPLSRGGSHWPANLAPACKHCNLSKNNKTEAEYRFLLRHRLEQVA